MNHKVSVITVCFNAEQNIENTINSVLGQTYENIEYIIIDGGSKDSTMAIVNRYKNQISLIVSELDKGIYDAMNKGIRLSSGDWLIMMNAGDEFASNNVLQSIFSTGIPENKQFIYSNSLFKKGNKWIECPMDFHRGALNHQCVIYRKSLHDLIGYYIVTPKLIISDYLFFIQVPSEWVMKTHILIAKYEGGGASSRFPAKTYALCADVVFRRITFKRMLMTKILQSIGNLVPLSFKYKLKEIVFRYVK